MSFDYVQRYGSDFWFIKHIVKQEEA